MSEGALRLIRAAYKARNAALEANTVEEYRAAGMLAVELAALVAEIPAEIQKEAVGTIALEGGRIPSLTEVLTLYKEAVGRVHLNHAWDMSQEAGMLLGCA
jgi:hypothetical protein